MPYHCDYDNRISTTIAKRLSSISCNQSTFIDNFGLNAITVIAFVDFQAIIVPSQVYSQIRFIEFPKVFFPDFSLDNPENRQSIINKHS